MAQEIEIAENLTLVPNFRIRVLYRPDSSTDEWRNIVVHAPGAKFESGHKRRGAPKFTRKYYCGWNGERLSGSDVKILRQRYPEILTWLESILQHFTGL